MCDPPYFFLFHLRITKHFLFGNNNIKIALLCCVKSVVIPRDDPVCTYKLFVICSKHLLQVNVKFTSDAHIYKSGFPHSSVGKESTCNARDPSLIPGSGRSPGEGIGYPLQYFWTSLMAQMVKNPPLPSHRIRLCDTLGLPS